MAYKHDSIELYRSKNLGRPVSTISSVTANDSRASTADLERVNYYHEKDGKDLDRKTSYYSENDQEEIHKEPHFMSADIVRDVVIGLADGLTVPFALAAGLATLNNNQLVVTAGLAEVVAGAISMGMGGYMAGLSELEHYDAERLREMHEVETVPWKEEEEIVEIFEPYGLIKSDIQPMLDVLKANKEAWVDFMMKFELSLERPSKWRTWISAVTIGLSYFEHEKQFGGLLPLIPYMVLSSASIALYTSLTITLFTLFVFGYIKGRILGVPRPLLSGLQMAFVGGAAAGSAFGIASAIPEPNSNKKPLYA